MKITSKKLNKILTKHELWLEGNPKGVKANLEGMDLSGADLSYANLKFAILWNTDLQGANLQNTNLQDTNLGDANLSHANLWNADLSGANLSNANLHEVNLNNAKLRMANLSSAYLVSANLCFADLSHAVLDDTILINANLTRADLSDAYLKSAFLNGVNLCYADLSNAVLINIELEGANLYGTVFDVANGLDFHRGKVLTKPLIGYKKCKDDIIVTLEIPRGAVVFFSVNGKKCRANVAKVIAIDGANEGVSSYDDTTYRVGDEYTIFDFNYEYNRKCASGIHFFVERKDAEQYVL